MSAARVRWRRIAMRLGVGLPLIGVLAGFPGCGSSSTELVASIDASSSKVKPGDNPEYTVHVVNRGPGAASGVTVRVDLPSPLAYKATTSLPGPSSSSVRTLPQDPATRSTSPTWGTWVIPAPVVQADGTVRRGELDIGFTVTVSGAPGDYEVVPRVYSDSVDGEVTGAVARVSVGSASQLTTSLTAQQPTVKPGGDVLYRLLVANTGSGQATGLDILITLPPGMEFDGTDSVRGNSSRASTDDPVKGSTLVRYGGWIIPAGSDSGPGLLTIVFRAKVLQRIAGGRYAVTGQITDQTGTVIRISDSAPVIVQAPTPTPVPSATPTPTPAHR